MSNNGVNPWNGAPGHNDPDQRPRFGQPPPGYVPGGPGSYPAGYVPPLPPPQLLQPPAMPQYYPPAPHNPKPRWGRIAAISTVVLLVLGAAGFFVVQQMTGSPTATPVESPSGTPTPTASATKKPSPSPSPTVVAPAPQPTITVAPSNPTAPPAPPAGDSVLPDYTSVTPTATNIGALLTEVLDTYKSVEANGQLWTMIANTERNLYAYTAFRFLITDLKVATAFGATDASAKEYWSAFLKYQELLLSEQPLGSDVNIKGDTYEFSYDGTTGDAEYKK